MPACLIEGLLRRRHCVLNEKIVSTQFPRIHRPFGVETLRVVRMGRDKTRDSAFPVARIKTRIGAYAALSRDQSAPVGRDARPKRRYRSKSRYNNRIFHHYSSVIA